MHAMRKIFFGFRVTARNGLRMRGDGRDDQPTCSQET